MSRVNPILRSATLFLLIVFLFAPLLALIPVSLTRSELLVFPPDGFSLEWYKKVLSSPIWRNAAFLTFTLTTAAAFMAMAIGLATAYWLETIPAKAGRYLALLLYTPLLIPAPILALACYITLVVYAHLPASLCLIIAYTITGVPYAFTTIRAGFQRFPLRLDEAARTLGANPWQALLWVRLNTIKLYLFSGFVLAWTAAVDDVVFSVFLADYRTRTLSVVLWENVRTSLTPEVAVVSVLLVVSGLIIAGGTLRNMADNAVRRVK